jgi:ABC-type transport system involved in Fe-S cluster assembly fused permease/ATPase subunit
MDAGRIVEQGRHGALLHNHGLCSTKANSPKPKTP